MNKYKKSLFMQDSPSNSSNPQVLTVSSSSANGAKPYFGWRLEHFEVLLVIFTNHPVLL